MPLECSLSHFKLHVCPFTNKEYSHRTVRNGMVSWNPVFNRDVNDWELPRLNNFFSTLYSHKIDFSAEDIIS